MTVDVNPAKGAQIVTGEEAVVRIDIVQVIHETEGSVGQTWVIALQPCDGLSGEGVDVVHAGLVSTVEVLE